MTATLGDAEGEVKGRIIGGGQARSAGPDVKGGAIFWRLKEIIDEPQRKCLEGHQIWTAGRSAGVGHGWAKRSLLELVCSFFGLCVDLRIRYCGKSK